ncbi:LysR family transcriptional regulator [Rhizobium sp.]|uniref:LysR family transcriptional regulator n=1 Tax=Rhizobium sp. TaxID=391 RepID=UPI002F0B5BD1
MSQLVFSRFLRYFAEVARLGSIRKASEHLNVSASAIDRQILHAEEVFGIALFERLPSGLRLSAAGELLLRAGKGWSKEFSRLQTQMEDLRGLRRGHVTIAVIDALSKGFVPEIVKQMREDFPGISFTIKVLDNIDVGTALSSGEADFGVMLNPRATKDLQVYAHFNVMIGLATLPDHPIAGKAGIRFNRCADYPIVAPAEPLALCEQVDALVAATSVALTAVAFSDNIQMIKSLVKSGVGVGILSSIDIMSEVEAGELAFTPLTDTVIRPLSLAVCAMPVRQLSSAANLVLDRMVSAVSDHSGRTL